MRIFWQSAPSDGSVYVVDVLSRGMKFYSDEVDRRCPTCGQERPGKFRRTSFRWLDYDVGCKPTRFFPRFFYLPPELEPLGEKPELRAKTFLQQAVKLLRRKNGLLFVWWRTEDVGEGIVTGLFGTAEKVVPVPPGQYLLLSPYWSPPTPMDWSLSEPPGPKYPKRV